MSITIDVVQTDFKLPSQYITFIYAGRKIIASNLLKDYGSSVNYHVDCVFFTRLLDAVDVPEDAIETTGRDCFLKIELQTTLIVGQNNVCWQHTLYAKVYVLFQCQRSLTQQQKE